MHRDQIRIPRDAERRRGSNANTRPRGSQSSLDSRQTPTLYQGRGEALAIP